MKNTPMFHLYRLIDRFFHPGTGLRPGVWILILSLPMQSLAGPPRAPWVGATLNDVTCRGLAQGYGPFDYLNRKQLERELDLVEEHHFSERVETLIKGQEGSIIDDLDYTLRAWPNHHRALITLVAYVDRKRGTLEEHPPPECYLQRAINFSPKDEIPRLLYAIYLHQHEYQEKALEQYKELEALSPNNPELHYNLGLLLVSMKRYDEATIHAQKAYEGGYPLPGLKQQLKKLGYWQGN